MFLSRCAGIARARDSCGFVNLAAGNWSEIMMSAVVQVAEQDCCVQVADDQTDDVRTSPLSRQPHHLPHTQPPDPSAIAKVFAEIDTSADGKISEDEFIRFFADNSMEEMKRRVQTLHDDNKHAIVRCLEFPIGGLAQHGNGG